MNAMQAVLLDSLDDLGYEKPGGLEDSDLLQAYSLFSKSEECRRLIIWLTQELQFVNNFNECVHDESLTHEDSFKMELSAFLREIDYLEDISEGDSCLQFLQHLCSELMCGRMLLHRDQARLSKLSDVSSRATEPVQCLVSIMKCLGIKPPPKGVTTTQLFTVIQQKLAERSKAVPPNLLSMRVIKQQLGPVQFQQLEELNDVMTREYSIRRQMLLKRLDCTIESFGWTDRMKGHVPKIKEAFEPRRAVLSAESTIGIPHLLAARDDILRYYKTSSSILRKNTISKLNKVMMGSVPDRGGRPHETAPPPEEMPAFKKREAPLPDAGGRGGGFGQGRGRGGAGGRVQDRNWQQRGDGNRGGGGGYNQNHYQQGGSGGYYSEGGDGGGGGYNSPGGGYRGGSGGRGGGYNSRQNSGRGRGGGNQYYY